MYGQPHTAPLPVVGVTAGPGYATLIEDAIDELRTTLDAKVTPASMDINTDLDFRSGGVANGAINLGRVQLAPRAALVDPADETSVLQVDATGELYYNDAAGNQVQLTGNGAVLGAAGNITGIGYGTGGVTLDWVAGSETFMFYSGPGAFADVAVDDVLMDGGSGNFLRMTASPMVGNYTITWPAAPGFAQRLMQVSTAGAVTFSNSGVESLSLTANTHATLSGTGRYKHGDIPQVIPSSAFVPAEGTAPDPPTFDNFGHWECTADGSAFTCPVQLDVGKRIRSLVLTIFAVGATTARIRLYRTDTATDTRNLIGTATGSSGTGVRTISLLALDHTLLSTGDYWIYVDLMTNDSFLKSVLMTYDHP